MHQPPKFQSYCWSNTCKGSMIRTIYTFAFFPQVFHLICASLKSNLINLEILTASWDSSIHWTLQPEAIWPQFVPCIWGHTRCVHITVRPCDNLSVYFYHSALLSTSALMWIAQPSGKSTLSQTVWWCCWHSSGMGHAFKSMNKANFVVVWWCSQIISTLNTEIQHKSQYAHECDL